MPVFDWLRTNLYYKHIDGSTSLSYSEEDFARLDKHIKTFKGAYEITSIIGNINTMNDKHYSHIHVNCSKKSGKTVGGHLIKCVISLTSEIFINVLEGNVDRYRDETLQINKFKF